MRRRGPDARWQNAGCGRVPVRCRACKLAPLPHKGAWRDEGLVLSLPRCRHLHLHLHTNGHWGFC